MLLRSLWDSARALSVLVRAYADLYADAFAARLNQFADNMNRFSQREEPDAREEAEETDV